MPDLTMTEASKWRFALAEKIAASYIQNPKTQVVMVAGSVGRGCADAFSDLEIDVYYSEPPTETDRIEAVERCGGTLKGLAEDADEWEEQMEFNGFPAATSTFLIETMENYLTEVVDRCEIAPEGQTRLYSLQHAIPITGTNWVEKWRAKAEPYPQGLVVTMLQEYLPFHGFGYDEDMLAARNDLLRLYDKFVKIEQQILGALLGLNRIYMPSPDHTKRMDEIIASMHVKPENLAERLKQAFHIEPQLAVRELKTVISEILALVEQHLPEFDITPYRDPLMKKRISWDRSPVR